VRTLDEILKDEPIEIFLQKGFLNEPYFFERVFGEKPTDFHVEWLNAVKKNRFVCITSFRGSAKTTTLAIRHVIWLCWYYKRKNVLIISQAEKQSKYIMEKIKDAIESNELLKSLAPDDRSITWSKLKLTTTTGCVIETRNLTESIRGLRCDLVICDEAQDYTDLNLFHRVIEPTVDLRRGKIIVIGTSKSPVDLLSNLSNNPLYWSKKYPILKGGKSLWS
jgi:hypothetical protein